MAWFDPVDGYCERLGPEYWAEPANAASNAAFLLVAAVMWSRTRGIPVARAMVVVLAVIGVGSYLFHTHANRLTGLLDVVPIVAFIMLYVFAASRDMLGMPARLAGLVTLGFIPYSAVMVPLFGLIPGIGSSAGYAPVPLLILIYAAVLRASAPATARGLALGAGVLTLSLLLRTLDGPLCGVLPVGTHFAWHILNALMLGGMIEVYRRHHAMRG